MPKVSDRLDTLISGLIKNGNYIVDIEGFFVSHRYQTDVANVNFAWLINKLREIEQQARQEEQEK